MKTFWQDKKLYLILDAEVCHHDKLFEVLKFAVRAGVDIVQLRDKKNSSRHILKFCQKIVKYLNGRIPFIVNDRLDLAIACKADGVHLGQEDVPVPLARKIIGTKMIVGLSCQTIEHALKAQRQQVDYIGFGSVFQTLTKPDRHAMDLSLIPKVVQRIKLPVFFIGGISLTKMCLLKNFGVDRIAVTRSICLATNVKFAVQNFRESLDKKE